MSVLAPLAAGCSDVADDKNLMELFRRGNLAAFEELYRRHKHVAIYVACSESDNPSDGEEIVSEAFIAVFRSLSAGGGPEEFFKPYLLTTIRRMSHRRNVSSKRMARLRYDPALALSAMEGREYVDEFESAILARAFRSLPDRWRRVLWCSDVEGMKPSAVAGCINLSPNGVSSLLLRAREGLRQAYLQEHVSESTERACRDVSSRFGKLVRGALGQSVRIKIERHLATCATCTEALREALDVQTGMRSS